MQLDMLAYVDESGDEPVLVVGGGVPADWTKQTMSVKGLHTNIGRVDWEYKDNKMVVDFYTPEKYAARPGPAFGKDVEIRVVYHKER